jgi:hypothetical protein
MARGPFQNSFLPSYAVDFTYHLLEHVDGLLPVAAAQVGYDPHAIDVAADDLVGQLLAKA